MRFYYGSEKYFASCVAGSRPPPYRFTTIKAFAVAEILAYHGLVLLAGEDGTSEGLPTQKSEYPNLDAFHKNQ